MKKLFYIFLIVIFAQAAENQKTINRELKKGFNLSGWFQTSNVRQIQFKKYTDQDFANFKQLGLDHVRLPVNLHAMTNGYPDFEIDSLFFNFLDQVVAIAEQNKLYLIVDNHTFDPAVNTDPSIEFALIKIWAQIAKHYSNSSEYLLYEILNEPHGISDEIWNEIQRKIVNIIRLFDTKHTIIVGPAGWNSYYNLQYMPQYEDTNLIYTFHFYDPFLFTHQGASWTDPSMVSLTGVPFPFNSGAMPQCPPDLKGTWIESSLNNYSFDGTIQRVQELIDIAVDFSLERNVPVHCGEFGVLMYNSAAADRSFWHQTVSSYFEQNSIPWTLWEYGEGFGVFKPGSNGLFEHDLNTSLLSALGLNVPLQTEFELQPDSLPFIIYDDYIAPRIFESGWTNGIINFYNSKNSMDSKYCIEWKNASQYDQIGFDFKPNKDLSKLLDENYHLELWLKCDSDITFDIRFLDTKTGENDHPWRIRYIIDQNKAVFDGQWHQLRIPLKNFTEHGSWDNGWFEPQGKFDWKAIDRFEIVAEHQALENTEIYFDEIKIEQSNPSSINNNSFNPQKPFLRQNYPNPFNSSTNIEYYLIEDSFTEIILYSLSGKRLQTILKKQQNAGLHKIRLNLNHLASGVYVCYLKTDSGFSEMRNHFTSHLLI